MAAPQQRVVDLREIVREVLDRYQALARQKCLALVFEAPTSGLDLLCDPADLERLVVNLVSNAVKYTQHGSVTITLSGDDDHVRLEVADTGIGIPQDALPHLFKEFYRASNAKAVEESGTGLGLSIVKLLVERYGGHITIASVEGQGTTFSVEMARAGVTDAHSAHDQGRRDEC
jgi:signal transduction histidine kinase